MIYRFDVKTVEPARDGRSAADPLGESIRQQIREFAPQISRITAARIFLIDSASSLDDVQRAALELLADPIIERAQLVQNAHARESTSIIEIHLKPGVTDPVAASTETALRDVGIPVREVRTGRAYHVEGTTDRKLLDRIARKILANDVIESIHFEPFIPSHFPVPHQYQFRLRQVPFRSLADPDLLKLCRESHLFLSLQEMKAIQDHFRALEREPTDVELETLAQTWSEHCVHKTLKSAVEVVDESGKTLRRYDNLIRDTIFAATQSLMKESKKDFCLSVFKDNAGVISFDDTHAVCFKVETHNHPSAIEPYGGAATGIGGCIRDVMGTGLGAKPVANTDVFCVAFPQAESLPRGVIHPKRILQQVVAGVRDYGNRMGIPTVNGAVYFDDRYIGNPLVFAGCAGIIPRDRIDKSARPGDLIVLMGGRTGRDGIHGATFSSAELTDTHADEFSHAVQIGNPITQKKMLDVILQARDRELFSSITDCGAGGLSSAVGEMGEKIGALVHLDKVPLKYAGLRYDEIWISEAQERMVLAVPPERVDQLLQLASSEDVEASVIGHFGTENRELMLKYRDQQVGQLSMRFLHHGLPIPKRKATVTAGITGFQPVRHQQHGSETRDTSRDRLLEILSHPNIASKHWIIRQYDHEVQGGSVIKPLMGPLQIGPSDASVIRPKLDSYRGIAVACGLAPYIEDPYAMAVAAIDEAIRNAVSVGAHPDQIAILDNFCWPSVEDERTMGSLVRACEACRDAALAYEIPFISGKDSLNNQFTDTETGKVIRIPNTLLISAIAVIDDVRKCVSMDLKGEANLIFVIEPQSIELSALAAVHRALAAAMARGLIASCHDISDGGALVAAAEMCIASGLGLLLHEPFDYFNESPGRYLVEARTNEFAPSMKSFVRPLGRVVAEPMLKVEAADFEIAIDELTRAWRGTLDW